MFSGIDLDQLARAYAAIHGPKRAALPDGFRVLVCGGRDYFDRERVFAVLDGLHAERPIALIIHGAARGADSLAGEWAVSRGVEQTGDRYKITSLDWQSLGPKAGPLRNQQMLDECKPDLVAVFPGGRGTANMMRRAQAANVPLMVVGTAGEPKT